MTTTPTTEAAVHVMLQSFAKAFRRKFDKGQLPVYFEALVELTDDATLARATKEIIRNEDRFPTIATVLRYCRGETPKKCARSSRSCARRRAPRARRSPLGSRPRGRNRRSMPVPSLNRVMLIGRIGKPGKVHTTPSGRSLSSFSLAVNSSRRDRNGQWHSRTDWIRCAVFYENLVATVTAPEAKGMLCYVEGRIQVDQKDQRSFTSVSVDKLAVLLPGGRADAKRMAGEDGEPYEMPADEGEAVLDDDIPF